MKARVSSYVCVFLMICMLFCGCGQAQESNGTEDHYKKGVEFAKSTRYSEAIDEFDKEIKRNKNHAPAYCGRGRAYYLQGENLKAIENFDKAIKIDANGFDAYMNRAYVLLKNGEFEKALNDYLKAATLNADDEKVYYMSAVCQIKLMKNEDATSSLNLFVEKLTAKAPESPKVEEVKKILGQLSGLQGEPVAIEPIPDAEYQYWGQDLAIN